MTFVVDGTNGLTFNDATTQSSTATNASNISSGTLGKARLPTGSVLQVVQANTSTQVSSSSATFVDTGLTATITPSSATSKILVLVSQNGLKKSSTVSSNCIDINLVRGATNLLSPAVGAILETNTTVDNSGAGSINYLDSPATTSATTYKTQFASRNGGASVQVQYANISYSNITLLEISA